MGFSYRTHCDHNCDPHCDPPAQELPSESLEHIRKRLRPIALRQMLKDKNVLNPVVTLQSCDGAMSCGNQVFLFGGRGSEETGLDGVLVMDTGTLLWQQPDVTGASPCHR